MRNGRWRGPGEAKDQHCQEVGSTARTALGGEQPRGSRVARDLGGTRVQMPCLMHYLKVDKDSP